MGAVGSLIGDGTPEVPSTPVQIGTTRPHHVVAEAGSWQVLIVMFVLVLAIGAAVLMYAVRQRARLVERRRVRRMAEAAAVPGDGSEGSDWSDRPPAGAHHTGPTGPSSPERVT